MKRRVCLRKMQGELIFYHNLYIMYYLTYFSFHTNNVTNNIQSGTYNHKYIKIL
jgi:hypothetical protein